MRTTTVSSAALLLLLSSISSITLAADPRTDAPLSPPVAAARAEGDTALRYFASGQWEQAYEAFSRADKAFHAPTLVLYMAHTQRQRGKLLAARELYRKVANEKLPGAAPLQFVTAQVVAREELSLLEKRLAILHVALTGPIPDDAQLALDGESKPVIADQTLELDPGDHVVELRAGAGAPISRHLRLQEGATVDLALPASEGAGPASGARARGPLAPAIVAFSLGAVGLGVGAATGAASLGKTAELRSRCGLDLGCPASAQPLAASAGRLADASTIAFVAAGALVVTGIILAVVRPGGAGEPRPPRVVLSLGGQSVVVMGVF